MYHTVIMKKITLVFCLLLTLITNGQQRRECGTKPRSPLVHHDMLRPLTTRPQYAAPYPVRIFIHVFADNAGANRATADTSILRQVQNMANFYAPHDICFIVAGIDQINNTALWSMNADTEEADLLQYLVPGCIDIFVHEVLFDSDGSLNGIAYDIPNHYLSIVASAAEATDNISTLAHEMGHCFGLIHTFQDRVVNNVTIRERVNRTGACSNCNTEGDLVCDTEADWDVAETSISSTTCQYIGNTLNDDCNNPYVMTPTNIMTYGRRSCRNNFTNGQGTRARAFLLATNFLEECIAENSLTLSTNQTISSGIHIYAARNQVTVNAGQLVINGSAAANFSAKQVVLSPGTRFAPTGTAAYVSARAGTVCQ